MVAGVKPVRVSVQTGILLLVCLLPACGLQAQTTWPVEIGGTPHALATLVDAGISEASGLVASRRHAGCYYVHNDSGGGPVVYLVDREGQTRLTIRLQGVRAVDYEDIAVAPGGEPGIYDVCVGDTGDNDARRPEIAIYRFPEPDLPPKAGLTTLVRPRTYRLRYPDGPRDAEALAVHPQTGDAYIVTKRVTGGAEVYKLAAPWSENQVTVLTKVGALKLPPALVLSNVVTAADISPDGRWLAVRCYADGWEWRLPESQGAGEFDSIFQTIPRRRPLALERQGEALCYAADGLAILTVSEGPSPMLYELPIIEASEASRR